MLSHPLDYSVSDINRIKRHTAFVLQKSLTLLPNSLFVATFLLLLRHVTTAIEAGDGGHIVSRDVAFLLP
jgi:hypothetical protein